MMSSRREELVGIAGELFAQQGYERTTVREIAEAGGIMAGSLYHHFESKEAIADDLLDGYLSSLVDDYRMIVASSADPESRLKSLVLTVYESIPEHRAAIIVLQNEYNYLVRFPRFAYLRKCEAEVEELWVRVLRQGAAEGVFRADLDARITYRFLRDSVWLAARWFDRSGKLAARQLAEHYLALILDGLRPRR